MQQGACTQTITKHDISNLETLTADDHSWPSGMKDSRFFKISRQSDFGIDAPRAQRRMDDMLIIEVRITIGFSSFFPKPQGPLLISFFDQMGLVRLRRANRKHKYGGDQCR